MIETKRNGKPSELASLACSYFEDLLADEFRGWQVDCQADAGHAERWSVTIGYREEPGSLLGELLFTMGHWHPVFTVRLTVLPGGASLLQMSYCEDASAARYWDALLAELDRLGIPAIRPSRTLIYERPFLVGPAVVARVILAETYETRPATLTAAEMRISLRQPARARHTIEVDALATWQGHMLRGDVIGLITLTETAPGQTVARFEVGETADWWVPEGAGPGRERVDAARAGAQGVVLWWWDHVTEWTLRLDEVGKTKQPAAGGGEPEAAKEEPEESRDELIMRLWREGYTAKQIGDWPKVALGEGSVRNELTRLRKLYGVGRVPCHKKT